MKTIKIDKYSDSDSKLQIEDIFKKKVINGIFCCWLDEGIFRNNV